MKKTIFSGNADTAEFHKIQDLYDIYYTSEGFKCDDPNFRIVTWVGEINGADFKTGVDVEYWQSPYNELFHNLGIEVEETMSGQYFAKVLTENEVETVSHWLAAANLNYSFFITDAIDEAGKEVYIFSGYTHMFERLVGIK